MNSYYLVDEIHFHSLRLQKKTTWRLHWLHKLQEYYTHSALLEYLKNILNVHCNILANYGVGKLKCNKRVPFRSAIESNRHQGESGLDPHFTKVT